MKQEADKKPSVEIWGGIECTINRIGDSFFDQVKKSGHYQRIEDLQLIADLGIKTIRYPVLWEQIAPRSLHEADWSWTDERLNRLKELNIIPIAGLLHHGSGPSYTSLTDPDFPQKFAAFAAAVADRYPWLEYFTPINEPLTTARFSSLYGYWYPHAKDDPTFCKTLFNECKGTILAMREIKKRIPNAKLVQTEDLGKTYSTPQLAYQATFENERRWSSFDLLMGRIIPDSIMWNYFRDLGKISEEELEYFRVNTCTPDILGINHYITSERYLDHRLDLFPAWTHGGNGIDRYADIELVRMADKKRAGHYHLLKEAFERYKLPLALTEVHLGCTRDEQLRWFKEAWDAGNKLKSEGYDMRAITAWSLLGAYDWNSLLVFDNNFYEPGVFDVRSGNPRSTALAHYIKNLIDGSECNHPVLFSEGWWNRPESVLYSDEYEVRISELREVRNKLSTVKAHAHVAPLLITGARGTLGRAFAKVCEERSIPYIILTRQELDIANPESVDSALLKYKPWGIINAAGFVRVDEAEHYRDACLRENSEGPSILAELCDKYSIKLLTFSSDLVFDGKSNAPYKESDPAAPLNIYGVSKFYAETKVLRKNPNALVIRTSAFFGPWDEYNFLFTMMKHLKNGKMFLASKDHIISPTYVPDLVNACLDLLIDNEQGIWHISNPSEVTWAEFALLVADKADLNKALIKPIEGNKLGFIAERPLYSALGSERGVLLPSLDNAIDRYLHEVVSVSS